ncbi:MULTISPECIES: flagellar basal body-associated protein FliL [Bacillaceae]|uniref:flagellar basal body-associated protein FliL n=1 Tax=Bacillaceae TaxID=186817 RepID=UPI0005A43878|nr:MULTISPECIES: flagellar basal body-associated protein FliL [Bacillaceae]MCB5934039.1 flagellar basal body-associated protein FliL [Bacillus sp. DFI.2.34]MCB7069113.1 flagellar basal body-associated protein FliL [Caldibacillus sp. 210928-DFI.2.22]MCB7072393.1 flagellar basal body-associated protein FliL [Caldibacillus sp. 210928-DFI.2.18]MCB7075261.1 flagellar basal body-associated protein FliL [Caldibacillus thermoamylovorans]MDL0418847.1 flagellar basal body-associated protein FliL [Caldib
MKKTVRLLLIFMSVVIIALAVGLYYFFMKGTEAAGGKPTADEIVENSVEIPEITTNLLNGDYIRISFTIQTDGKKAKEELEKRNFQVENVIIKKLSGLEAKDLEGTEGKVKLEKDLKESLSEFMEEGKIIQVYITSTIIQ